MAYRLPCGHPVDTVYRFYWLFIDRISMSMALWRLQVNLYTDCIGEVNVQSDLLTMAFVDHRVRPSESTQVVKIENRFPISAKNTGPTFCHVFSCLDITMFRDFI